MAVIAHRHIAFRQCRVAGRSVFVYVIADPE
jgi:hypothetical protein